MPVIEVSEIILASPEDSFLMICNPDNYPRLLPEITVVQVLERQLKGARTSWSMDVEGLKFKWVQQDKYYPESKALHFWQTEGDMLKFEGLWCFAAVPEGTKVSLSLDFDPGMPMLSGLLHYVLVKKVREILAELLKGFKELAETTVVAIKEIPT